MMVQIMGPLKYLNTFWGTPEMSLIVKLVSF